MTVVVDRTATLRRQARKKAAAILVAAGRDRGGIAPVVGISPGSAPELLPKEDPPRATHQMPPPWKPCASAGARA